MSTSAGEYAAYRKVDVETASQGKLIIMLFNGAIQRAEEAKRQIEKGHRQNAHKNLIRAQEIVAELRGALNMRAGTLAANLDRIYEYFQHLLIKANIRKEIPPIQECLELMVSMRNTWQELFEDLAKGEKNPKQEPLVNQHGSSVVNIQG